MFGKLILAGGAPALMGNILTGGIPAGTGSFSPPAGGGGTYPLFSEAVAAF